MLHVYCLPYAYEQCFCNYVYRKGDNKRKSLCESSAAFSEDNIRHHRPHGRHAHQRQQHVIISSVAVLVIIIIIINIMEIIIAAVLLRERTCFHYCCLSSSLLSIEPADVEPRASDIGRARGVVCFFQWRASAAPCRL